MDSRHPAHEAIRNRVVHAAQEHDISGLLTDEAICEARELASVVDVEPDIKSAWALGMFHWLRYLALPEGDDLEDYAAAVRLLAPVYEQDPGVVPPELGQRYERIRRQGGTPPPDPAELNSRAMKMINSYRQTGELPPLAEAVELFRAALAAADGEESSRARFKSNLGAALRMLSNRTGDHDLLTSAIALQREALAAMPDEQRSLCQSNLATALFDQYLLTREPALLEEAIVLFQAAADGTGVDDPERSSILSNLAAARTSLAAAAVTSEALAEAVESHRALLLSSRERNPERPRYLVNLGGALQALAERTTDRALLAEAVEAYRIAVAACPARHPDRPGYLSNLAAALTRQSEATGDATQLKEVVGLLRAALAAVPRGDVSRSAYLSNFGSAALRLGERTGDARLMTEAVEAHRIAVELVPDNHPEQAAHLSNLGLALQAVFERTGNTELLAEAVSTQRAAVAAARSSGSGRPDSLANLGVALRTMSETEGNTSLLAEAVQASRAAVAAALPGDPGLAGYLSNLGMTLQALAEHSDRAELLAEAVQTLRAAASVAPRGHPDRGGHLSNLGLSLIALSEQTGEVALVREAVQIHKEAVAAVPNRHPRLATYLSNLGIALQALSGQTGDGDLLAHAVTAFRQAMAATLEGDPQMATCLVNLGNALQIEHDAIAGRGGAPDAGMLTEAASYYAKAAGNTGVRVLDRIYAYRQVARLAVRRSAGADALAAAEAAAGLLPQVTPRTLVRRDRERQLGQLAGLAGDVAAAAISAGRPDRAAELLEQTRGLLVAETLQARSSDLARLRAAESGAQLAAEFEELQRRIDALDWASSGTSQESQAPDSADLYQPGEWQVTEILTQLRQKANQERQDLITRIRKAGFPDFLQSPAIDELAKHAAEGPVVLVFTSPVGCGALVLTAAPPRVRVVPLPGLTETGAFQQANQLRDARIRATLGESSTERRTGERQIHEVLAWLWDAIAGPILTALGYTATPDTEGAWPRLWWCPVGILAYLPLHAAGHRGDNLADNSALRGNPRTALDRVVSSYTPTIRGLAYARAHPSQSEASTTLIVAVPEAPGVSPLAGVAAEAEALSKLIPGAVQLADPSRERVLEALLEHPRVHFACHGFADPVDPGASELVMPDRQTRPLTLRDISSLQLDAEFAFLSACDTFVTSQNLADEGVHITGAFHLAGYKHVIGTLWSINDLAATEIALGIYKFLTANGTTRPQEDLAAPSLHHATLGMRAKYPDMPSYWVTHTHTGA